MEDLWSGLHSQRAINEKYRFSNVFSMILWVFGVVLGRSWGILVGLGRSWGGLGAVLGKLWAILGWSWCV